MYIEYYFQNLGLFSKFSHGMYVRNTLNIVGMNPDYFSCLLLISLDTDIVWTRVFFLKNNLLKKVVVK